MKNYPLLVKNQNTWLNWTKTYLTEVNSKVCSLFHYTNYFIPDYYRGDMSEIVIGQTEHSQPLIDISLLKYREYVTLNEECVDQLTGQTISAGSRIVSKAQSEGEKDLPTSDNRQNPLNYFIQPIGWASFYLISTKENKLLFDYDAQAEEKYGLNLKFSIEWFPTRWYLDNADTSTGYSADGLFFSQQTTNRQLSVQSSNEDRVIIRSKNGTEWLDNTDKKPLYIGFFGGNESNYGEEIIIDTTSYTSTRFVETNKGVYNITLNNSVEKWPTFGIFLLY